MANSYLDSFRAKSGVQSTPSSGNSYLSSYRSKIEQEEKARRKKKAEENIAKMEAEVEKSKSEIWNPANIGKDILKAGGDLVNTLFVDPAKTAFKQAEVSLRSGQIAGKGSGAADKGLVQNQIDYIEKERKSGRISNERAEEEKKKLTKASSQNQQKLAKAEQKVGVKSDQSAGVMGVVDTLGNASLLGLLRKPLLKGAEKLAKGAAKETTEEAAPPVVTKPTPTASLKTETPTGIQPSVSRQMEPQETTNVSRSQKYVPDELKPRVTESTAVQKLKTAGYSDDEAKVILADALPEKALVMPGSPKKIGLNDESIAQAAKNFDETRSPRVETSIPEAPLESSTLKALGSIDDTVEIGTSKLGASVQDSAVNKKLISRTEAELDGLPQYNKANMKQQAKFSEDLIKTSPQEAIDVAMGRKAPPEHILPQMVYNAVEEHARKIGGDEGGQLLRDLARSKQVTNLTTMGQNIRAAAERDPFSPVTMINEIKHARATVAQKRGKSLSKATKADAAAVKKATPKIEKEDWNSFIKGLEC